MMAHEDVKHGLVKPNEATFVSVLSSCTFFDVDMVLYIGRQLHAYIIKNEELSVFMTTALIAFYGKMDCLVYASKIFDAMDSKQVCTWNAMISSLDLNGREKQALTMYEKIRAKGLQPNEITFVAVLSACACAKLVDFGFKLFKAMSREFGLIAKMEHYDCVADLLGRAGLLQETYDFIKKMPFEANATVLGALMGACRLHGVIELGNEVSQLLLESQPNHFGRYVQLSNIYAGTERWDHAASLRKEMLDAGIHKVPVHKFV